MSQVTERSNVTLQPLPDLQVESGQDKDGLKLSSESPKRLSVSGGHSMDEASSSSSQVSELTVHDKSVPSLQKRDSQVDVPKAQLHDSQVDVPKAPLQDSQVEVPKPQQRDLQVEVPKPKRQDSVDLPDLPRRDSDNDLPSLERIPRQQDVQDAPQVQGPSTYKTKDLHISDDAATRLGKIIDKRIAKQDKLKTDKAEARKDFKARFDKFLKEFKSVFKNTGKLAKAVGDTGKGVREAVVTGDQARLGGFNSEGLKAKNEGLIKGDGMSGTLKDVGTAFTVVGGVTQLVETGADIYLFNAKVDKSKADAQTITEYAQTLVDLAQAKKDLNTLMSGRLKTFNDNIQDARDIDLDPGTIQVLVDARDEYLAGIQDQIDALNDKISTLTKKVNDTAVAAKLAQGDYDKFHEDLALELTKLYKSSGDGLKAAIDLSRLAMASGTAVAEGFKAASGTVGAVIGPITFGVNLKDAITDIDANRTAVRMKHVASGAIKGKAIEQSDAELVAIAERIRLKQKKQSVDKGLSATKNMFGAVGGLASGVAGAATIAAMATSAAVGVAAIATPVGWALAGTAALAAVGYGIYKLARHINSSGIKAALQGSIKTLEKQNDQTTLGQMRVGGLGKKETQQLDRVAGKLVEALKAQGVTKTPDELTVAELRDYSMKKLLARDTGVATTSLYHRFRDEVAAEFGKPIDQVTDQEITGYLQREKDSDVATSAMGLMSKLGVSLSAQDALMLLKTGDKGESSGIKFLSKKLKLA